MRKSLNRLCLLVVALLALVGGSSCVHEWPEPLDQRNVTLEITHQLPWDLFEWTHTRNTRAGNTPDLVARYIVGVYPEGCSSDIPVSKTVFYRADLERGDFRMELMVPAGRWDLRIWSDNANSSNLLSPYYDPADLGAITYGHPFIGGDKYKDAFVGNITVDIPSSNEEQLPVSEYRVELKRPLTAFAFIATDLKEFIEQEDTRTRNEVVKKGLPPSFTPPISLDDYRVEIGYSGFLPSVYHIFSDRPIDSSTGVGFSSGVSKLNEDEALLGHDFVFINGRESTLRLQLNLYHKDGTHIARVNSFDVPVKRNRCTIIRGEFLTSKATGSTGINPDFDGEFNIEYK